MYLGTLTTFAKSVYALTFIFIVAVMFLGFGYLILFNPSLYVDIRNWHFRKSGFEQRFTLERCSRFQHRATGLPLFAFGAIMLYFAIKGLFH
jgi:hypothetical protein